MFNINYISVFLLLLITAKSIGFHVGIRRSKLARHTSLKMTTGRGSFDFLGLVPLCIEATSKTTTTDDPTAGMTADEITNYVSNVGGGLCGYPESVKTAVGLGLNLSLITFGILTLGYIILGAWNFALEKSVEESIKKLPDGEKLLAATSREDTNQGALFNTAQSKSFSSSAAFDMDPLTASQQVVSADMDTLDGESNGYGNSKIDNGSNTSFDNDGGSL